MPGFMPGLHAFFLNLSKSQGGDGRDKPGHDAEGLSANSASSVSANSHLEYLRVALLDLLGAFLYAYGIFLHQLDFGERAHAGLLHRLFMRRILTRPVDQDLLALAAMH